MLWGPAGMAAPLLSARKGCAWEIRNGTSVLKRSGDNFARIDSLDNNEVLNSGLDVFKFMGPLLS